MLEKNLRVACRPRWTAQRPHYNGKCDPARSSSTPLTHSTVMSRDVIDEWNGRQLAGGVVTTGEGAQAVSRPSGKTDKHCHTFRPQAPRGFSLGAVRIEGECATWPRPGGGQFKPIKARVTCQYWRLITPCWHLVEIDSSHRSPCGCGVSHAPMLDPEVINWSTGVH